MKLTVHGHLIDLCTVILLNVSQDTDVIILHKVDGHTSSAVSTRPTNSETREQKNKFISFKGAQVLLF